MREARESVIVLIGMIAMAGDVAVGVMVSMSLLQPRSSVSEEVDVAGQAVGAAAVVAAVSIRSKIRRDIRRVVGERVRRGHVGRSKL